MMRFEIKAFDDMSRDELYRVLWLRDVVFVVGQKITAVSEIDGLDPQCHHAMLWDGDDVIGTARIFADENPCVVGRVAVHTDHQGKGLGTQLMRSVQDWLGDRPAELHAQAHLESWYSALGWTRQGDVFMEAEIPHVTMTR
ncbi:MAG: GNAT family N-acetyltransferase [bacterium]